MAQRNALEFLALAIEGARRSGRPIIFWTINANQGDLTMTNIYWDEQNEDAFADAQAEREIEAEQVTRWVPYQRSPDEMARDEGFTHHAMG